MKKDKQKTFFILITLAFILIIGLLVYNMSLFYGSNYRRALESENTLDKCSTPPGYTDVEWREHMGHHPDMYKECLS